MDEELDAILSALADPTRRRVVDLLAQGPHRASDLADGAGMSRTAMSRHLRVLRRRGLVEEESPEADARVRLYSLRPGPFRALRGWLDDVEAFWSDALEVFDAHAEKRGKRS